MWDDEAWQKCREVTHQFIKNEEESVIKEWLNEIGYTDAEPVGYYRNAWKREIEIYSTRVGCLIGKAGVNVRKLENLLHEHFLGEWKVKFVEIRGGFVQI